MIDFKVSYQVEGGIVSGKIEGGLTKELAAKYFTQVGALASERGYSRVLTDVRAARLLANVVDMESLSKDLSSLGLAPAFKRAIVLSEDVKAYKTWENYCFRNGYQQIKLFFDHEKAVDWLSEN